jgi:hypothetical protein
VSILLTSTEREDGQSGNAICERILGQVTYRVITEIGFILVEKILLSAWYISWSMLLGMI